MSKDIHEVQMDVMEWMEITDLKEMIRQSKLLPNKTDHLDTRSI